MTASKKPAHQSRCLSLLIVLACGICGAQADDLATPTPSPTPAYLNPLARRADIRRAERIERRSALDSRAQARAKQKAGRANAKTAQAQARQAAREREQAQRQLDAQARQEKAKEPSRPTSDLMKRMGFSEQEIAAQKASEEGGK